MQRSIPALTTTSLRRSQSTAPPSSSTPTPTPPTSSTNSPKPTPTNAKPPPPPPPSSNTPPPSGPSFIRRAFPFALLAGAGYVTYKASTDNEFRSNVKETFPAAEGVLKYIPAPPSKSSPSKTALSSEYESVPKILLKIEGAKTGITESDLSNMPKDSIHASISDVNLDEFKSSDSKSEAKAQASQLSSDVTNATSPTTKSSSTKNETKKADTLIADVKPKDPKRVVDLENVGKSNSEPKVVEENVTLPNLEATKPIIAQMNTSAVTEKETESAGSTDVISGKARLARLLGKGDFDPNSAGGKDVIDQSSFGKPKHWNINDKPTYKKPTSASRCPVNHTKLPSSSTSNIVKPVVKNTDAPIKSKPEISSVKSEPPSTLPKSDVKESTPINTASKGQEKIVGNVEIEALRTELASQAKWEAVRLQEAVRAQLIEDNKAKAKEVAEMEVKHSEEVARIQEEATKKTMKLISEKADELEKKYKQDSEDQVKKIVNEKEVELREELNAEYTGLAAEKSKEREIELAKAEAKVETLCKRFDAVVAQTEKAKEATSRATGAFVLGEAVTHGTPLGKALKMASGRSDLAGVIATSVPEEAVKEGVKSVDGLREEFINTSRRGLSAAAVPESKKGSIWAHALAAAFTRLKVPVDVRADGIDNLKTNEQRIRLAQLLVNESDIEGAVKALNEVDGLAKDVVSDWLEAAKCRIAATKAVDVLLADAIVSQACLMKGL